MHKIFYLLIVYWLFGLASLKAQTAGVYAIGGSILYGTNVNVPSDRNFGSTSPIGINLFFHKYRDGSTYWEKAFHYPQTGWGIMWINHRNNILGSSFALKRYINYVFFRKKAIELYLTGSQGIMVATDIYKPGTEIHPQYNNAIGQRINFSEELGCGLHVYTTHNVCLNFACTFNHFSNGSMSRPNDGLNLLMLNLGVAYSTSDITNLIYKQPEKREENKKLRINICIGAGVKQLTTEESKKYPLLTSSVYIDKKLAHASAISFGVDIFMNSAVIQAIKDDVTADKNLDYKRIGLSLGHELFIDRVGVLTQVGYHIYSPYAAVSKFYQKFGVKYYITKKLFVTFTVRTFKFSISDEVAWGFGFRL